MFTRTGFHEAFTYVNELRLSSFVPAYSTPIGALFQADAIELLTALPSDSVDLVMTSPPLR